MKERIERGEKTYFKNIEVRNISDTHEIRADNRHVTGYAIRFNSLSENLGGFREIISPKALTDVIMRSDCFALLNHNIDKGVLARSKNGIGTLLLQTDDKGLLYSFSAPKTAVGDELLQGISRGDITGSSFSFSVTEGGDTWERGSDGRALRRINQIDLLYDVSPCYRPSYQATDVALRAFDSFVKKAEHDEIHESMLARVIEERKYRTPEQQVLFEHHLKQMTDYYRNRKY